MNEYEEEVLGNRLKEIGEKINTVFEDNNCTEIEASAILSTLLFTLYRSRQVPTYVLKLMMANILEDYDKRLND